MHESIQNKWKKMFDYESTYSLSGVIDFKGAKYKSSLRERHEEIAQ